MIVVVINIAVGPPVSNVGTFMDEYPLERGFVAGIDPYLGGLVIYTALPIVGAFFYLNRRPLQQRILGNQIL